jgi:NRAMP (natural resistance-associated macrophage protein)-like metal ion transporter
MAASSQLACNNVKNKSKRTKDGQELPRFFRVLGPGLITGASDDDPSGIGTYSQAGAQIGFGIAWTMLLTFPLMAAIQEISARIGRTTGHGIAGNLSRHYPKALLYPIVALLFLANAINVGADLSAMGDALKLLVGGSSALFAILFGATSVVAIVFMSYDLYVQILKWMTLVLFAYVATLFAIKIPWGEALHGIFIPTVVWSSTFFTTLVAILGTTISPYLFFWQAAQEAEDQRVDKSAQPLVKAPGQAEPEFHRIRADTLIGMAFSNLIALSIILTTAAAFDKGTSIESSAQAAAALRPNCRRFRFYSFCSRDYRHGLTRRTGPRRFGRVCDRRNFSLARRTFAQTARSHSLLWRSDRCDPAGRQHRPHFD